MKKEFIVVGILFPICGAGTLFVLLPKGFSDKSEFYS